MGSDVIGDVPWGTHVCQFCRTKEDLTDILGHCPNRSWRFEWPLQFS